MIVGIGTDILHIPRLKQLIAKRGAPVLARRILSPRELTEFKALIRGKLELDPEYGNSTPSKRATEEVKRGDGFKEVTSFRTILKGLNRNVENDSVVRFLANRWAAKEACYKALYPLYTSPTTSSPKNTLYNPPLSPISKETHVPSLTWKSVDLHYVRSKPFLRYTYGYGSKTDLERDSNERKMRMPNLHVTLSHDGDYVAAFVVAEEEGSGGKGSSEGGKSEGEGKNGKMITYR